MNDGEQQLRRVEHTGASWVVRGTSPETSRPSSQQRLRQNAPRAYNSVESMRNAGRETAIVRFLFPRSATPASVRRVAHGGDCVWRPALDHSPLEVICQHRRIALVETPQFFHILHREHGFTKLTLFRHS